MRAMRFLCLFAIGLAAGETNWPAVLGWSFAAVLAAILEHREQA